MLNNFKVARPIVIFLLAVVVSQTPALAQRKPADIPIADFFKRSTLAQVTLSPDGTKVAMLVPGPDGRNALAVADVETPNKRVGVARFDDADISSFSWVNNHRLVLSLIDLQAPLGEQALAGLYAVNSDGSEFVYLVGRGKDYESGGHAAMRPLRYNHALVSVLRDGSDDVIMKRYNFLNYEQEAGNTTLLRVNTVTKATKNLVNDPPENAQEWVLDRDGIARAAMSVDENGQATVHARTAAGAPWKPLISYSEFDPPPDYFLPIGFGYDGKLVVAAIRGDDAHTHALYYYDVVAKSMAKEPFFAMKGYDVASEFGGPDGLSHLLFDHKSRTTVGVSYLSDARGTAWFDGEMKQLQERVDALLPNTNNIIACAAACKEQVRYVVTAYSDQQTPIYFLLDRAKTGKEALTLIGAARPWLDASSMASQDIARIKARDGLEFAVYVTKPQGKGPWPTVVLVHGGPNARGAEWGWRPDTQFLASRGYLVVEPEFRGSVGYGDKLLRAGWKQWGLAMQDDVTDATKWAVAQGLADPKRLVIAGASYGGYATMMGLVKEPDLYRAGINWVGVTDIDLMYSIGWSDFAGSLWQRYGMARLVGDREKDKAQLDATSPLKRATEIKRPVLMAYGTDDKRVPLPHGTKMRDALKAAGKVEVEWVEYEQEGHGFMLEKNNVDFWGRVERFLARNAN